MPQNDKSHDTVGRSELEGKSFEPATKADLAEAIRLAFDYRGDTTLSLHDGTTVEGFLFNHIPSAETVEIFVKEGRESAPRTLRFDEIKGIYFTGADVAFGKSWDDWQTKSAKQREADAERAKKLSEELGHL